MKHLNTFKEDTANCTIVMPIYNRTAFFEQAFTSLSLQTYTQWRLIVVDDGSNDNPEPILAMLAQGFSQPIYYLQQSNTGPGAARQIGIAHSPACNYFAFFDSDDEWLPNYLKSAIDELERYSDIDWVFQACKRLDHKSGETLLESTFQTETGAPVPFLTLPNEKRGETCLFLDNIKTLLEQIKRPIDAGFQNSVIRSNVTQHCIIPNFRIGEDRYFLSIALMRGFKLAYIDKVGVLYHVHDSNISDTNVKSVDLQKKIFVQEILTESYRALLTHTRDKKVERAIKAQIANIYFWQIGYNGYLSGGFKVNAIVSMVKGIITYPSNYKFYKTLLATLAKLVTKR